MPDSMTFESFVVTKENGFAFNAAKHVAEQSGVTRSPLFLWSGPGLGKTHLLQAVGDYVAEHFPQKKLISITSEQFTDEFVHSLRDRQLDGFNQKYLSAEVLLIDDVQFFECKEGIQRHFFSILDELERAGKTVVLACDRPPKDVNMEERYQSRFAMGLMADIQPSDTAGRIAILRRWAEDMDIALDDEAATLIVERSDANLRTMKGGLIRVSAYAQISLQPIDVDLVRSVMGDPKSAEGAWSVPCDVASEVTPTFDEAHRLLDGGLREAGLEELRAAVARELVGLSWNLRLDTTTNEYHPETYPECEHLISEAEAMLSRTQQRADGSSWLAWHTAARRLFLTNERWAEAAAVTRRQLDRIGSLDDSDTNVVERLEERVEADSLRVSG